MREQSTDTVLMILSKSFGFNEETATSNAFQNKVNQSNSNALAREEVLQMANQLREEGVIIWLIEDEETTACPDAVFPNNWLGIHPSKEIVLYPMFAQNRRFERRSSIIKLVQERLPNHNLVDLSNYEQSNEFLEGTGSLVFDHIEQTIYASKSIRTSESLARMLSDRMNYQLVILEAADDNGNDIYHTNVVLSIGTYFAIAASANLSPESMKEIRNRMKLSGRMLIEITNEQMLAFAGNVLELKNEIGEKLIVITEKAFEALKPEQIAGLQQCGLLIPISVKHIEHVGGGSVRCMLAEIFA
jgi:hypothetical protein